MTHELHLGDCLELMKALPSGSVDTIITDPPYGARRPSAWRLADEQFAEIQNNDRAYIEWLSEAFRVLVDGGAAYVFTCWDKLEEWRQAMTMAGFRIRSCVVWDKAIHGLGDLKTCWGPQHELILFGAKGRHELRSPRPKDVIRVQRVNSGDLEHPYQKPVQLMEHFIRASSDKGQMVLDCFMGSGSTGLAAQALERNFIGMELNADYFAIAQRRIEAAQQQTAFNLQEPQEVTA
jgi:site-specific DNA-methyltransferase (adenine-specific)